MSFDEEVRRINDKKFEEMLRERTKDEPSQPALPGKPVDLSESNFQEAVNSHPLVVVDFWAPWCGPCKVVSPVLEQLSVEMAGKATFFKLNVDDNPTVSQQFGIQGIPTIMIFKDGRPVDGIVGAAPKQMIEARIRPYISADKSSGPYR
ncbi:MAG TPA: thioredoxin [Nitrososphaerales archaeon]|nr:thioredoxin [Nitrososphaerales archaeon]